MEYYVYEFIDIGNQIPFYINIGTGVDVIKNSGIYEVEKYKETCNWRFEINKHFNSEQDSIVHMERIKNNLYNAGIKMLG